MKQEHEMTPGVLVSGDDMSAGDYKARVAVLEAELAELRGRVCVPVEALEHEFPLLPDNGLDEVAHHCEWAIQQDRKRLHAFIAAHQQRGRE